MKVAISFGENTTPKVLVGYRLDGQDWRFGNVTAGSTHQFISDQTPGFNLSYTATRTFELRVTNWAYGVQIAAVHLAPNARLVKIPNFPRTIEIIGDSLSAGQYNTYEALSTWSWSLAAGLSNTEFSISAYPGICLTDRDCWGNPRGQEFQWFHTQDTSWRARQLYNNTPEKWDFAAHEPADLVVINIGTNDQNKQFDVSSSRFRLSYERFVERIHDIWPNAQIIIMSLSNGHYHLGSHWGQNSFFKDEIIAVYDKYKSEGFIHYFNTTGIMQHNDIGPEWHPTDIGQIKLASHLMQYINMKFGWNRYGTGDEVESGKLNKFYMINKIAFLIS
jgi:lysophospholipase L1-like esterase